MKRSPGKAADARRKQRLRILQHEKLAYLHCQTCKDKLPDGWGAERFVVKEGGEGRVGFYSPGRKQ